MKYDVIIVGAGIGGLYCAKHLPKNLNVLILHKEKIWECNTFYAQGGISFPKDDGDKHTHIQDSLNAGGGHNNFEALKLLTHEAFEILRELILDGFKIDKDEQNNILYTQEGGHSLARIIHSGGDATGRELHMHCLKHLSHVSFFRNMSVADLLIQEGQCYGVRAGNGSEILEIYAHNVVIASGGLGGLYARHTNAKGIDADLHGIILEHNLTLADMEMLQFHPSVYVTPKEDKKILISEAVRGEGGIIVNDRGERFLFDYDQRGELAPRDIVSRAIFEHARKNHSKIYLDLKNFTQKKFEARFPNIYRSLKDCGLDIPHQKVPIFPAFHYAMGGIEVGLDGKVSGMKNLYALGECAKTGVHGANRLASNSLLEGMVFGKIVAQDILKNTFNTPEKVFSKMSMILQKSCDEKLKIQLQNIMWNKAGIIRDKAGLSEGLKDVQSILQKDIGRMFYLNLLSAQEIFQQALRREESLGAHFRID
ncbi:L-aspartate oxidase [Helicobacter sp. 11S03491-1]|nr:FAD-binding protein [Helicobacter sp. 11S03491-1]PAF42567.1 L-aspartate oxidase [Helicobacter sp. 11S03491-1]